MIDMSEGKYSRRAFLRTAAVTLPAGAFLMSSVTNAQWGSYLTHHRQSWPVHPSHALHSAEI